jgi:hypothetical protein
MAVAVLRKSPTNFVTEEKMTPAKTIKVKVIGRWSVVHDDQRYVQDDELSVPESIAADWERSGWVERVGAKS